MDLFVTFYAVIVGAALLIIYVLLSLARVYLGDWLTRRKEVPAILVRKSTRMYGYDSPLSGRGIVQAILRRSLRPRGTACLRHVCWVTFRTREREMEFTVPESLYARLPLGCEGTLTFKGEGFIDFKPYDAQ